MSSLPPAPDSPAGSSHVVHAHQTSPSTAGKPISVMGVLRRMAFWPVVGMALGALVVYGAVIPRVGVGEGQRLRDVTAHLRKPNWKQPAVLIMGNSVTVEGVDARVVGSECPGVTTENVAINAAGVAHWQVLWPTVLSSQPRLTALVLMPTALGPVEEIPVDVAYAMNLSEISNNWPAAWTKQSLVSLPEDRFEIITGPTWKGWLHFRRAPLEKANSLLRGATRQGMRLPPPEEYFQAPYQMAVDTITSAALENHLKTMTEFLTKRAASADQSGRQALAQLLDYSRQQGSIAVIVLAPVHPRLAAQLPKLAEERSQLAAFVAGHQGRFIDASAELKETEFADILHPNARGRALFSRFLGRQIQAILHQP